MGPSLRSLPSREPCRAVPQKHSPRFLAFSKENSLGHGEFDRDHSGMSRPRRVPEKGDVSVALIALRLGLSAVEFELNLPELERRGFPAPDPTTRLYAIEAVDRWRLRRYPRLFPELTASPTATHADAVFNERMQHLRG